MDKWRPPRETDGGENEKGMEQNPRQYGVKSKDTERQRENRKALMKRMRMSWGKTHKRDRRA